MSVLLEHRHRPLARGIETIQVRHGPLDRPEIHLIVRMAQMITEPANGPPQGIFGSCTSASAPSLIAASDISRKHIRTAS